MIGGTVRKLRRSNINDPLSGSFRDDVHEAVEILAGIPEAHSSPYAALIVGGGAAHVEGHHALILMPDVHHSV